MSTKIERPSADEAIGRLAGRGRQLERGPGQWIFVGTYPTDPGTTPESPHFKNGHANAGVAGFPLASFYIDKRRRVYVRGAFSGDLGTVIFTLPVGYRPPSSERFACAGDTGPTILQVDPNGDVTQVF